MKIYLKIIIIISILFVSIILVKFVHVTSGVSFFIIGMFLIMYFGFVKEKIKLYHETSIKEIPYNIAFVSGVVGDVKTFNIPKLPSKYHSYWITNNIKLAKTAKIKGWNSIVINLPNCPIDMNPSIYWALQSKKIKVFPQKYLPNDYDFVVWSDNTFEVNNNGVIKHIQNWDNQNAVVFHKHPFLCCGADIELTESLKQKRYLLQKQKIDTYINEEVNKGFPVNGERHFQAGFIIYNIKHNMCSFFQETWIKHINRCGIQDQISLYFVVQRFSILVGEFKDSICKNQICP